VSTNRTHNTARLPLRIPQELLEAITAHAAARSESRSDFARRALSTQISRDHTTDEARQAREAMQATGPFFLEDADS